MVNPDTGAVITPPEPSPDAVENAKEDYINNRYYEDLYSGKEGTLGKAILTTSLFEKTRTHLLILLCSHKPFNKLRQSNK